MKCPALYMRDTEMLRSASTYRHAPRDAGERSEINFERSKIIGNTKLRGFFAISSMSVLRTRDKGSKINFQKSKINFQRSKIKD